MDDVLKSYIPIIPAMNAFFNKALMVTDDIIPREIGRMIEKDSGSFR